MPYASSEFKKCFSLPERGAYLNCAGQGPLSKAASEGVARSLRDKEFPYLMDQNYGLTRVQKCRDAISKLVDCAPENVALANSTSWGVNTIAQGLELKAGDEVIMFDGQFPSNIAPWFLLEKQGIKCVRVPSPNYIADLKDFQAALTSRTKVATLEWVHFVSGDRIPIEEVVDLCHKRGIIVVVDVTQGLGAIPFSMKQTKVDAITCSAYKWLYSPYGSGFMALTSRLIGELNPIFLNWLALDMNWTSDLTFTEVKLCPTARRFDASAHMGYLNLEGMTSSVEWLNTLDIRENFQKVRELVNLLKESLDPKLYTPINKGNEDRQSCIATFLCPTVDGTKLITNLQKEGFYMCIRNGALRVSPSIYNDKQQILDFTKIANGIKNHRG